MDNKYKTKYLREYIDIVKELDDLKEYYRNRTYNIQAQVLTDMPRTQISSGDVIGAKIVKLESVEEAIEKRLCKLNGELVKRVNIIDNIKESELRRIMDLRYIQGIKWENICVELSYSWRHLHRLHSMALEQVNIES